MPTLFVLEAPIFKGLEASRFQVEVALEVTDGAVAFWFESPELSELEQNTAKMLLDNNAKYAEKLGIAVLVK